MKCAVVLFPVQQAVLSFQLADFGQILADLKASPVVAAGIPYREVTDIDKFAAQFDPKRRRVPGSGFESVQDFVDHVNTIGRVAVAHLAADDRRAARKDSLRSLGIVGHPVVLIEEC